LGARLYFVGSRLWWAVALFIAPVVGAIAGSPIVSIVAAGVLVLPAFLIFDTDREWWSDEVRRLPEDKRRSRAEVRWLTLWAVVGLGAGLAIARLLS
jgi:hypothetical protein